MKRTNRLWMTTLIFIVAMFVGLAGCSQESAQPKPAAPAPADPKPADASAKPAEKKTPRVAFVYIGPPGDGGYTYEHDQGRKYMEKELGIKADFVENVPESADAERVITELAQNHDLIFTTSFGYMDYTLNVAKKYPKVIFMHASGFKTAENMGTYFGRNYQASYLAGIAAGKMTKKNLIGYVGAFPIPEVIYNINAFTLGAQSVNPDVKLNVVWSNTWYDPATERQAAVSLLDKGADVIAAYQDSPASLQAAQERGAFGVGNDSDMTRFAPDAYITSAVWKWGPYYSKVVKDVMNGTWKSEQYWGSMKDGIVDIAPLGKNVPDEVKKLVEAAKLKVTSGELNVFKGPITDAAGAVKVPEGKVLEDKDILSTNWFVKGIEGTIPK
ncbi:BMP family ABC transporter substrate-binding protein [Paenibacillus sp. FSL H7-0331]|uniref:BMP family ABC transporter substrate-binding protein n=1 Tax=Paenibacillus sp. FSL H7-0331 TaxID=1920421 RepID=UPI00096FAE84|nr:BMP family ABC transporter substrate-binding protein [Paenibacillus sp. FSL H7-0331]OMF18248.1 BMP family ABC transporter substrate-binding protein [Paenibacillus sp. FSL H7-0331]